MLSKYMLAVPKKLSLQHLVKCECLRTSLLKYDLVSSYLASMKVIDPNLGQF